ncbi:MAG: hypothetical protein WD906_07070 [Anaerolineales bacterium]
MNLNIGGYPFEGPFNETKDLKNAPGLYAVHIQQDEEYTLVDLGQAADVQASVRGHSRQDCWLRHSKGGLISFSAYYTPDLPAEVRAQMEGLIREELNPPCGLG